MWCYPGSEKERVFGVLESQKSGRRRCSALNLGDLPPQHICIISNPLTKLHFLMQISDAQLAHDL